MISNNLQIRPLAGALGAELLGPDLAGPLSEQTLEEIHRAFLRYGVIVFRDQRISPEQQLGLARGFGPVVTNKFFPRVEGHPDVAKVVKEKDDVRNVGGTWHSDHSYDEEPALGSLLYALEVPTHGGDTLFASMKAAYEALSEGMQDLLLKLKAVHSAAHVFGPEVDANAGRSGGFSNAEQAHGEVAHPVVRTHPETGEKGLYVNPVFTLRFEGMTQAESQPLLDFLYAHATRPEFTCRLRWEEGSLALWDNRAVQHLALNDYHGQRREMHRVTIAGDRPF